MKLFACSSVVLLLAVSAALAVPAPAAVDDSANEVPGKDAWSLAARALDHCGGSGDLGACLGVKAVTVMERLARAGNMDVLGGAVTLVRTSAQRDARAMPTEAELQSALPQDSAGRSAKLIDMFVDATLRFFESHSVQLRLPHAEPQAVARAIEEGRGKMKKMMGPIMAGIALKIFAVVPILIGFLGLLAVKALVIAKIAFVIAAVIAAQKLLGGGGGGIGSGLGGWTGGAGAGWSSGAGGAGWSGNGGYSYKRSMDEAAASDLAYSAHAPQDQ
ncbi:Iron-sulfur cluster repair protein YtfE [Frankliniella fusca]|uniref:Iron-sulfur cluster repair protein YtfE n=1 Tax=Frankliniella fusca TaxID=407009 RepID=A0AAE1I2J0_9NEOP|nr:Iron-sulfur cluster repair protein YtfE [Frankliniella fusca]